MPDCQDCVAGRGAQASRKHEEFFVKRILLAAALAATTAIAVPIIARSAQDDAMQEAQVAQADDQQGEEHQGGPGHWMRGEGGPGMHGWRGMMMPRMMPRDPKAPCDDRLAWRAARRAYSKSTLH